MEWMILPFKRYADFTGRSRRKEYWMFFLLNTIITLVLLVPPIVVIFGALVETAVSGSGRDTDAFFDEVGPVVWGTLVLYLIYSLASFIPSLALGVRRFHDRGITGWAYGGLYAGSLVLTPLVGFAILVIAALPGDQGPNQYGPAPLDPYDEDIFA